MAKQEEIKEKIAQELAGIDGHDWEDLDKYKRSAYLHNAEVIMCRLHSQGYVVNKLKVRGGN